MSTTVLWLNRANDAANAELVPEMRQIYQFRNRNASSIRALLVADAKWMMAADNPEMHEDVAKDKNDHDIDDSSEDDEPQFDRMLDNLQDYDIRQSAKFRRDFGVAQSEGPLESSASGEPSNGSDDERVEMDDLKLRCPKYLIFLTGFSTYSPHQIGFKFIDNTKSVESLLRERQERNVSKLFSGFQIIQNHDSQSHSRIPTTMHRIATLPPTIYATIDPIKSSICTAKSLAWRSVRIIGICM